MARRFPPPRRHPGEPVIQVLTKSLRMSGPSLMRSSTARIAGAKKTLKRSGDSTHPCHNPWVTSNHSEYSPSSVRTRACMPSRNWRITVSIFYGTPKRASTTHNSARLTESYAFWRSIKHTYRGIFLARCSQSSHDKQHVD